MAQKATTTERIIAGERLLEWVNGPGHRISKTLRDRCEDDVKGLRLMTVRTIPRSDSAIEAVTKVTYNGHPCPRVNSAKRVVTLARAAKGARLSANDVRALVEDLGWFARKEKLLEEPLFTEPLFTEPLLEDVENRKRLGRIAYGVHHGSLPATTKDKDDLERRATRLGIYTRELALDCLFGEDGAPVDGGLAALARRAASVSDADAIKLRRLMMFFGEVTSAQHRDYKEVSPPPIPFPRPHLGRKVYQAHRGRAQEGSADVTDRAVELGGLTRELKLRCIFTRTGEATRTLQSLTRDSVAIASADEIKLRRMLTLYDEVATQGLA